MHLVIVVVLTLLAATVCEVSTARAASAAGPPLRASPSALANAQTPMLRISFTGCSFERPP